MAWEHRNKNKRQSAPLRVLESFPDPTSTTNPYIVMLLEALRSTPGLQVATFTWKRALLDSYDVFHAHWPETRLEGRFPWIRRALFALLLLKFRLTGVAIVRTQHNLDRPQGLHPVDYKLLEAFENQTAFQIVLNESTPTTRDFAVIKHGHYTDWYGMHPQPDPIPGRLGYFGLIRRYKAVPELIRTFRGLPDPAASLRVGGKPSSEELRNEIGEAASGDERVSMQLGFLSDAELVELARQSQVVVLPYSEMHNSGSALAALSLGRAVLVPDNEANRALAEEVGDAWVLRYAPPLTPEHLAQALESTSRHSPDARPDLTERGWKKAGLDHLTAYQRALHTH